MSERIGPWIVREVLSEAPERRTVRARAPDGSRVVLTIARKGTEAHRLLCRAADTLAKVRHPAVPEVVDVWESASHLAVARRWVQGTDLATLTAHRRLSEAEVLGIAAQVLEVLAHLHGLSPRIAHRGISPAHVIRTDEGGIALIGFGALAAEARISGRSQPGGVTEAGHYPYAPADELIGGGVAADVYAVGATVIHALLGRTPKPGDISAENPDLNVGRGTREWLAGLLEDDPLERRTARWALNHLPVLVEARPPALPAQLAARALPAPPRPMPPPPPPPVVVVQQSPYALVPIAAAAMGIATWLVVGGVAIGILLALAARHLATGPHLAMAG